MAEWQLPSERESVFVMLDLLAYWDERTRSISRLSQRLGEIPADERAAVAETITEAVANLVDALDDDQLKQVASVVADDLYKAASAIEFWSGSLVDYLTASAGTFFSLLRNRGYLVHYIVDNSVPDFERVLNVYGPWFNACGIVYICPQKVASRLMKTDGAEPNAFIDELPMGAPTDASRSSPEEGLVIDTDSGKLLPDLDIEKEMKRVSDDIERILTYEGEKYSPDQARHVANMLVESCAKDQRHFLFLDVDAQEDSFTPALALGGAPGVITVFRNEASKAHSNIRVRLPVGPAQFS